MAIDGFHINGTALVYVSTGQGNSLEFLGYTTDGVDVEPTHNMAEIMTDVFGNMTPHDMQDMGDTATMQLPMIATDRAVLNKVLNRGNKSAFGRLNTPGMPLGSAGYGMSVLITSSLDSSWYFYNCFFRPNARVKLGVRAAPFNLSLLALPLATYATLNGTNALLYTRGIN